MLSAITRADLREIQTYLLADAASLPQSIRPPEVEWSLRELILRDDGSLDTARRSKLLARITRANEVLASVSIGNLGDVENMLTSTEDIAELEAWCANAPEAVLDYLLPR